MSGEHQWLTSASPTSLLHTAKQLKRLKPRKSLLFACGCYRLVWDQITLAHVRATVERAEDRADRKLSPAELREHREYVTGLPTYSTQSLFQLSLSSLTTPRITPEHVAWLVRVALDPFKPERANKWEDCRPQADLLRDILANPFRSVAFDSAWRTGTAVAIAGGMYESREFGAMPILADALQDAGCDSDEVLSHCRDPHAVHVRGCWVVDLVLGRG